MIWRTVRDADHFCVHLVNLTPMKSGDGFTARLYAAQYSNEQHCEYYKYYKTTIHMTRHKIARSQRVSQFAFNNACSMLRCFACVSSTDIHYDSCDLRNTPAIVRTSRVTAHARDHIERHTAHAFAGNRIIELHVA